MQNRTRPILIAEDDPKTAALLALYLRSEGWDTVEAGNGRQALTLARRHSPQLIVLDLMLPELDGWELCRILRQESDVPILILSARDREHDRITGLSLGADDYVVKPFSPQEVVARVHAILRRFDRERPSGRAMTLDRERKRLRADGRSIGLTPTEFKLLEALMDSPGKVFSRQELLDHIYPGGEAVVDRVVDVHIGKIRQKIEPNPAEPRYLLTVRGFGYCFTETEDGSA